MAVVISVLGYACTREKIHPSKVDPKTEIAFDNLNLEISALNAKYPEITQTRGWFWRWFKRVCLADAIGALLGSKGGGAGALYGAIKLSLGAAFSGGYVVVIPEADSYLSNIRTNEHFYCVDTSDSVGMLHNRIISDIYNENGDFVNTMNQEDLQTAILQKMVMYCGDLPSNFLLKISEINEDVAMSENLLEEADSDVSIESIKAMFPEYTNELEVVKVYCDKLELLSTPELKADYTEELVLTIEASAIPEESKELLETSVKVGGNSNAMWKPVED